MRPKVTACLVLDRLAVAALAVGGCSSHAPSHPPALGDCVSMDDASCGTVALGGGGGSPGGGGGSLPADGAASALSQSDAAGQPADGSAPDSGADACAGQTVTANAPCQTCLQQSCCDACMADSNCVALITCAQMCGAGDSTCLSFCENQVGPTQVSAYDAFAGCLAANCSAQCPALP